MIGINMSGALMSIVATYFIGFLITIYMMLNYKGKAIEIVDFLIYYLFRTIGIILLIFSRDIPTIISVIIANTLLIAGNLFLLDGILLFLEIKVKKLYYIAFISIYTLLNVYFTYIKIDVSAQIVLYSFSSFLIHITMFIYILKKQKTKRRNISMMGLVNLFYAVYFLGRIIMLMITKESFASFLDYKYDTYITFIGGIFGLLIVIGLMSLINGRNIENLLISNKHLDFFANIYRSSPIPILVLDKRKSILHANKVMCDMLMIQEEDLIGKKPYDTILDKSYLDVAHKTMEQIQKSNKKVIANIEVVRSDGKKIPVEINMQSHYNEDIDSEYYTAFMHDLTELNKAQYEIIDAERSKNNILSNIPGFVYTCNYNKDWTMEKLSDGFFSVTGYKKEDVLDNKTISYSDMIVEEYKIPLQEAWSVCTEENIPFIGEYEIIKKNGQRAWVWEQGKVIYDYDGYVIKLEGFITNINELKNTEGELRKFKTISENSAHGNAITDIKGKIIYVNEYFARVHGYTTRELIGKNISIIYNKKRKEKKYIFKKSFFDKGYLEANESWHVTKDGREIPMLVSGIVIKDRNDMPEYMALTAIDITKMKDLEQKNKSIQAYLRNQQKLESVGTLAGGIAHEINNPINGIMNYSQLIIDSLNKDSDAYEYAKEIIHETKRVSVIVKNLLQFSRHETGHHSLACIEDIIESTLSLIRTIIKQDQIVLSVNLQRNLPKVKCRSQQIQQVLMNLMTNARDALNQKYKGYDEDKKIIIKSREIEIEDGKWVRITIEDHGIGIPEEIRNKIYDPFFTTKGRTKGTGLGLAISHGIVKEHKGRLHYDVDVGKSTKFFLDLPVTCEEV